MAKSKLMMLKYRQDLFREQVDRFQRCEDRRPSLGEVRRMWSETGFKTG